MKPKYKSLFEWRKANPKAYSAAFLKGLLPEICETFGWEHNTKEERIKKCILDAKKYKSKKEWREKSYNIYAKARRLKCIDMCFPPRIPKVKWFKKIPNKKYNKHSKEKTLDLAKNYTGKNFTKDYEGDYRHALNNKYLSELKEILNNR